MITGVRRNDGFSLIELSIAVTIIALVVATGLETYRLYIQTKIINDTAVNSQAVQDAMARYIRNFQALPCPAAPKVNPNPDATVPVTQLAGAGKGVAVSVGTLSTAAGCAALIAAHPPATYPTPGYPWCDNTVASPTYGICIVDGASHSAFNPAAPTVRDPVLVGSLPYYDLGLTIKESLDGWGNRFTYAVSFYETQTAGPPIGVKSGFEDDLGAINVQKSSYGAMTAGQYPGTGTANSWPFVIISHGIDGKGAYDYYGRQIPCTAGALDTENCNGDSTFILSGNTVADNLYSTAKGANYYDDVYFVYQINQVVDKWLFNGSTKMYNNSLGNVGIGNNNPNSALDVSGNVKASVGVLTPQVCDASGNNCMKQTFLGLGASCGSFVTGIANNSLECSTRVGGTLAGPRTCGGQFVTAIDTSGNLTCGF